MKIDRLPSGSCDSLAEEKCLASGHWMEQAGREQSRRDSKGVVGEV